MAESFFNGIVPEDDKPIVNIEMYQQIVGLLLYLALRTRSDILVFLFILASFQNAPTAYCHRCAKRVLKYLRGTFDFGVLYSPRTN